MAGASKVAGRTHPELAVQCNRGSYQDSRELVRRDAVTLSNQKKM
jgi:hypothetical protein